MYGIGNISSSVSKMLTPAGTLGAPGDMYVITDTRLRPRKDLSETKAFERFDIREFNSSEISRLQSEDPLLFEQIKADFEDGTLGSIRKEKPPRKTGIGYKVFVLKKGKLYPPMVANPNGEDTPVGVWLDADAPPIVSKSKTGRPQVKAGGKGTQGGSGTLAYRPGWHLGIIPYAIQFNRKDENGQRTLFPKNFVWAEVEYAADINYQKEAEAEGYTQNGKYNHAYAGLKYLPKNGYYIYRTNPDPNTDPWIITGAMKVNRILSNAEVDALVRKAGRKPQRRESDAALGKPTIKLEFETNGELADFLKDNKKAASFAEYTDVSASAASAPKAHTSGRSSVRQNFLMPGSGPNLFPESVAPSLPPTKTPPPLPPSTSTSPDVPPLPSFDAVLKNDLDKSDWNRIGFKVGNVGYINDKLQYLDVYIPRYYDIIENWMKFAEYLYPNFVVALCRANKDKWIFAFDAKKYSKFLRQFYDNRTKDMSFTQRFVFVYDVDLMEQVVKHFNDNGMQVALFYRHVYDGDLPEIITHPKAALPPYVAPESTTDPEPQPEPTEPEIITPSNPNDFDTPDWDAIWKRMYDSYHWNSFDPENAANYSVKEFKNNYAWALERLPEDRKKDFTDKFVSYIYEIARLNAAAPSAAVTGRGGVSAKQAAKYNAANDRYMEKRVKFSDWIKYYVDRANRIEERDTRAAMSSEQKTDARFEEIKKNVDYFAALLRNRAQVPSYSITNARQNLQSKIENEAYKGNVELVERLLEYMRPLNVYTNRSSVWTLADVARKKREKYQAAEQKFEEQNNDGNADYQVYFDTNEDRVKIYFNSIPSEQIRAWLKSRNFKWSPRNKAWQRQITTDSRYVVNQFNELYKSGTLKGLGKPTIKFEFENNIDLMSLFDTDGVSGMTVNDRPADVFNCPEWQLQCKGFTPTYERLENYDHLVAPAYGEKTLVGYGFDNATLDELVEACRNYRQVEGLAKHLQGDSALQSAFNIWHWLHTNVRYDYDAPGEEEIRTPARCYADRLKGVDCDCLAVMTACLLINMGYRPKFEIVGFGDDGKYSHIFVNLDGAAVDRVLPVFLQRPDHITNTKIMDIPVYRLNGCDVAEIRALSGIYADTLQRIENGDATADDSINFRKTQVLVTLQGSDPWAYRLGAVLMPYVAAVGDDGTYYFTNADIASLATQSDAELREMLANGIADEDINKWLANVIVKLNNAATADAMALPGTRADATQVVVIINPQRQAVTVEGNMFSAEMVTCNPLTAAMLKNLQMLFAVNFLGMATRFAIGLISAEQAAELGYSFDAYTKAVAAVNKLKGFYSALGGNSDNVIATIQTGSAKMPLMEYDENAMLVEISDTDATINGLANAVAGINGLGGAVTIDTAIASLGDYFNIIIEWVKDVTPATSIAPGVSPDGTPAEDDGNLLWYLIAGFAAVGAVGAVSGKKKKTKKK